MKKKMLVVSGILILALIMLAGCSGKGDKSAGSGGVVTLSFPSIWVGSDSKAPVFSKMITGFNQEYAGKYEVKVEEQTDYDAYRDKIRTQIATGNAPDIFTLDSFADLQLFASSGKLMDMTGFLKAPAMYNKFSANAIEETQINGINYAFPYEMAIVPIMMNGKLLQQAGVDKVPTSYEELWAACDKLKARGIFPTTQMTNNNAWTSMLWYSYAVAAVGGPDVYRTGLDHPAFAAAADIMRQMFRNTSSDAVGADASVVNGHFFNERAAIYTNGTWILGRIKSEGVAGLYDNLIISPGFSYQGRNGGAYVTSILAYFAAGKQTNPDKEAAVKAFFEYITDPGRLLELANSSGALFAINIDTDGLSDPVQAEIVAQQAAAPFLIGHFQGSMPIPVINAFPSALEALVLGDVNAEGFVKLLKAADE
ncbi:ABC transporter substrate-binding protein [Breznakiella homolactica]|uniref:Carbohydrate ABC transporter substrate-binding protein n=1 Tax=Breznakiella homolactica TaxID=2798577 RepID=A0A7T8BAL8_9SPIR|nr:ABC transporter substrate-binding protein [Breznakiella homolactica]QQO09501.1 ABC transporter substrate-binding protein [Breznakiella homolactica]